jgi:hypothetical protein
MVVKDFELVASRLYEDNNVCADFHFVPNSTIQGLPCSTAIECRQSGGRFQLEAEFEWDGKFQLE